MVQSLYKNWLLVSKITWGIWKTSDKQWKVQHSKLNGLLLSKNYISSAKTLYTVDLSNITFNYLSKNSPNFLCHFWNHMPFFTTPILCISFAQTKNTFDKSSSSKCKFSDYLLLALKFTKFAVSYFNSPLKPGVSFPSNFA